MCFYVFFCVYVFCVFYIVLFLLLNNVRYLLLILMFFRKFLIYLIL